MGTGDRPWLLRGLALALGLAVGLVAWLLTSGEEETAPPAQEAEPRIVDAQQLRDISAITGQRIYWAGPITGTVLEVTESGDGSVQVRYLDEGVEPGDEPAAFLTIGTYPQPDPSATLERVGEEPDSIERRFPDGRIVVYSAQRPTNLYFPSPENDVQVEVYDPSPKRALALALAGRVRRIDN
jgi:hypothetical protein